MLGSRESHIMTKTGEEVGDDEVSVSCSSEMLSTNVCAIDVRFVHVRCKCPALVPESPEVVTDMSEYPSKVNPVAAVPGAYFIMPAEVRNCGGRLTNHSSSVPPRSRHHHAIRLSPVAEQAQKHTDAKLDGHPRNMRESDFRGQHVKHPRADMFSLPPCPQKTIHARASPSQESC